MKDKEMEAMTKNPNKHSRTRIGLLLTDLEKANLLALRYLVLCLNTTQCTFEYEFLPSPYDNEYFQALSSVALLDREVVSAQTDSFIKYYQHFVEQLIQDYKLKESPPNHFIIISMARFSDNFYTMRHGSISILALGNWQNFMAPPSIVEFILTLILRESVGAVSPSLRSSIHLGTKGCLFDFTQSLTDVRFKVLNGYVCEHCLTALENAGLTELAKELPVVLNKKWLGDTTSPNSPASIALKLGYNLFTAKGFQATFGEKLVNSLQEEGIKQIVTIVGTIIIALLLLWLGLK